MPGQGVLWKVGNKGGVVRVKSGGLWAGNMREVVIKMGRKELSRLARELSLSREGKVRMGRRARAGLGID